MSSQDHFNGRSHKVSIAFWFVFRIERKICDSCYLTTKTKDCDDIMKQHGFTYFMVEQPPLQMKICLTDQAEMFADVVFKICSCYVW